MRNALEWNFSSIYVIKVFRVLFFFFVFNWDTNLRLHGYFNSPRRWYQPGCFQPLNNEGPHWDKTILFATRSLATGAHGWFVGFMPSCFPKKNISALIWTQSQLRWSIRVFSGLALSDDAFDAWPNEGFCWGGMIFPAITVTCELHSFKSRRLSH